MTVHRSQHEGGYSKFASSSRIDLRAVRQQQLNDVHVASGCGKG